MAANILPPINGAAIGRWAIIICVGILVAGAIAGLIFWYRNNKKYNKQIWLWKKINGVTTLIGQTKGCFERISMAGDFWVKTKSKKYLARPKLASGKDIYMYFEREDGEWINFTIEDIEEKFKSAGIHYIEEDMRLVRLGLDKLLENKYGKKSFWEQYGVTIMSIIYFLIITVCLIILFNNLKDLVKSLNSASEHIGNMANAVQQMSQRVGMVNNAINASNGIPLQ